jgi:hypothetical protein
MVSFSDSTHPGGKLPESQLLDLDPAVIKPRNVMIPCFIEVEIMSDDPNHAESCALALLRSLGPLRIDAASIRIMSVISPLCPAD